MGGDQVAVLTGRHGLEGLNYVGTTGRTTDILDGNTVGSLEFLEPLPLTGILVGTVVIAEHAIVNTGKQGQGLALEIGQGTFFTKAGFLLEKRQEQIDRPHGFFYNK